MLRTAALRRFLAMLLRPLRTAWRGAFRPPFFAIFLQAPVISPNGGVFTNSQTVTITNSFNGASIYYTLDGSTPTTNSTLYTGSFNITQNTLVQAIATYPGAVNSAVASALHASTEVHLDAALIHAELASSAELSLLGTNLARLSALGLGGAAGEDSLHIELLATIIEESLYGEWKAPPVPSLERVEEPPVSQSRWRHRKEAAERPLGSLRSPPGCRVHRVGGGPRRRAAPR